MGRLGGLSDHLGQERNCVHLTRDYVLEVTELAEMVTARRLGASSLRDREGARIIECVFSGQSDYIVAGDGSPLSLNRYRRVKIVYPADLPRSCETTRLGTIDRPPGITEVGARRAHEFFQPLQFNISAQESA